MTGTAETAAVIRTATVRTATERGVTLAAILAILFLLQAAAGALGIGGDQRGEATIALGFLLLSALVAGEATQALGLPRITGYIVLGLLVGPGVLGLVNDASVEHLRLVDDIAISLIALSAGGELRVSELRTRGKSMVGIMGAEMLTVFLVVAGGVLVLAPVLPFTAGRELAAAATIALIFGSIAIANSPSVAIAVINDTGSRGPVASTVLGVTVMKDVVVILFFAVALSVARTVLTPEGGLDSAFFFDVGREVGGSILAGAVLGWLISVYLRTVRIHFVLFALATAFLSAEISTLLHFEVLLVSLVAGFFVENISPVHGEPFVEGIERSSLALYALFFALAGASIHLDALARLWPFALAFVLARAAAVFAGTWLGARITGAEPTVRRYAGLGFISQAGVTLGMVVIAARAFPEWGPEIQTLFVAMVAIHELVGPVLFQYGLERADEVGRRPARPHAPWARS